MIIRRQQSALGWQQQSRWFWGSGLACVAACLIGAVGTLVAAQRQSTRESGEMGAGGDAQGMRVREGSVIEVSGFFKVSGDRAMFTTADGTGRYTALENLNLERIAIAVGESPDPLLWNVTGTVTEFRGSNFLLVTRALLKNKPSTSKGSADRPAGKSSAAK